LKENLKYCEQKKFIVSRAKLSIEKAMNEIDKLSRVKAKIASTNEIIEV
jgi:hypothetical protein